MKNNIKALHVTGFWSGNFYYRGLLPAMANEWYACPEIIDGANDGQDLITKINRVDIVAFQRPNHKQLVELMEMTKQKGKKIIFDDDDTFKVGEGVVPQGKEEEEFAKEVTENREKALNLSDGASCTTEFLAKELREHNNNVSVLPNCIDKDDASNVDENTTGKPRILILGSVISNDDYLVAKKAIESIADKVTFVLLGVPDLEKYKTYQEDMKFWRSLPDVEEIGNVAFGNYYNTIQETMADLVIAPRADNYFNRCKSNLKYLEASLFAIPFIGQAFEDKQSPYQVNNDKHLKLAQSEDDWVNILQDFLTNQEEYKKMGKEAQVYVCEEYDINKHAYKWIDFYKSIK
jgi:glycosyltransferase involved in cell wall biosynthesis